MEDIKSDTNVRRVVEIGDTSEFVDLLSKGYRIHTMAGSQKHTALHYAFYKQRFDILRIEVVHEHCERVSNYADHQSVTHLHVFAAAGNLQAVGYLLRRGEDVNLKCDIECKYSEFTPLHFAAKYRQVEMIILLLNLGANIDASTGTGETPLHLVCTIDDDPYEFNEEEFSNHQDAVEILLLKNANVNMRDNKGCTPIYNLFHTRVYKRLLYEADRFNENLLKPISVRLNRVRMILDIEQSMDRNYKYIQAWQTKIFSMLLEHEADVRVVTQNEDTLLHWVLASLKPMRKSNLYKVLWFKEEMIYVMRELLKRGVYVDAPDRKNRTALQYAVHYLSYSSVRVLLKYRADVRNVRFDAFSTAFRYPNILPTFEVVENLLNIMELLKFKGFCIPDKDYLLIIKFLVSNNDWKNSVLDSENFEYMLMNLVCYGSAANVTNALAAMDLEIHRNKLLEFLKGVYSRWMVFYEDEKLKSLLGTGYDESVLPSDLADEIKAMKEIVLHNGITLYDVMCMSPKKALPNWMADQYTPSLYNNEMHNRIKYYSCVVKGHLTKSLTRRYVYKWSIQCLSNIFPVRLPELCWKKILEFLENEDILSTCLST